LRAAGRLLRLAAAVAPVALQLRRRAGQRGQLRDGARAARGDGSLRRSGTGRCRGRHDEQQRRRKRQRKQQWWKRGQQRK
jgi:hypothetical protein